MLTSQWLFLFTWAALGTLCESLYAVSNSSGGEKQVTCMVGQEGPVRRMSSKAENVVAATTISRGGTQKTSFLPTRYTLRDKPAAAQAIARDASFVLSSLFAGAGSGALASVVCAPLDLMRTRMQVWGDLHKGQHVPMFRLFSDIVKIEGWTGLFRGLGATLATVPLFWGLYFPLYDELKRRWAASDYGHAHPSFIHCGSAIGAGFVSDIVCNPMFVVRTRMQTEALHQLGNGGLRTYKPHGMIKTAGFLYKEGGARIFWRGMTANLLGLSHVAIQFPVYELLKKEARQRAKSGHESPLDLLIASGLSKACASLITYPHEVIRSRMMDMRSDGGAVTLFGTSRRILAKEGLSGFYTGLHVTLLRVLPNCCITFMTYELLLRFAKQEIERRSTTKERRLDRKDSTVS